MYHTSTVKSITLLKTHYFLDCLYFRLDTLDRNHGCQLRVRTTDSGCGPSLTVVVGRDIHVQGNFHSLDPWIRALARSWKSLDVRRARSFLPIFTALVWRGICVALTVLGCRRCYSREKEQCLTGL